MQEAGFKLDLRKTFFYSEGAETLEAVVQRSCECPITGVVQGQVRQGFEQPSVSESSTSPQQRA